MEYFWQLHRWVKWQNKQLRSVNNRWTIRQIINIKWLKIFNKLVLLDSLYNWLSLVAPALSDFPRSQKTTRYLWFRHKDRTNSAAIRLGICEARPPVCVSVPHAVAMSSHWAPEPTHIQSIVSAACISHLRICTRPVTSHLTHIIHNGKLPGHLLRNYYCFLANLKMLTDIPATTSHAHGRQAGCY